MVLRVGLRNRRRGTLCQVWHIRSNYTEVVLHFLVYLHQTVLELVIYLEKLLIPCLKQLLLRLQLIVLLLQLLVFLLHLLELAL